MYKELKEPCKSAIANNICLGCTGLGENDWKEPKECKYIVSGKKQCEAIIEQLRIEGRK